MGSGAQRLGTLVRHRRRVSGLLVLLGALLLTLSGCGEDDDVVVDAQATNQPLPHTSPRAFELREVDGEPYAGAYAAPPEATLRSDLALNISSQLPGSDAAPGLLLATPCGFWSAFDAEIGELRITIRSIRSHLDDRRCTGEQAAAVDRVVAVLTANPQFTFDGSYLSIHGDGTTLGFELYVPEMPAVAERARVEALAQAEAEGRSAQAEVLRAGVPSFDSYKHAMELAIDCAREAGVSINGPVEQMPGPRLNYSISGGIAAHDLCYDEHAKYIDQAYQMSIEQ